MRDSKSIREELEQLGRLALPTVLGLLGHQGMVIVDTWMVTPLGSEALAGASLANMWAFGIMILARGMMRGLDPLVSQAFGARQDVGVWLVRGLYLALLVSLPAMSLHYLVEPGLLWLEQPVAAVKIAKSWCFVLSLTVIPVMLWGTLAQFLTSIGIVRPLTIGIVFGNVLNLGFNLFFMHVLGWGAVGCAWSTVMADIGTGLFVVWLARDTLRTYWPAKLPSFRSEWSEINRLLWLGMPLGIQQGLEVWGFSVAGLMMGWFGEDVLSAHSLVLNLASISFMFPLGIGIAAGTRVGHLVGAGGPWGQAAGVAVGTGITIMCGFACLFSIFPAEVLGLYRPTEVVLSQAVLLLPVAATFQLFDGIQGVSFGVLRGAGDLRVPALINVIGYYLLGLPLGYFLAFHTDAGPQGVWMGLTLALASIATLLLLRLRRVHQLGGFRV